jgi:uncharacterized protein YdaU (DUF1376 family)
VFKSLKVRLPEMSIKTDAWMPLWIGAYLADTMHLSRDEHGGYLLLIMAYWRSGFPLPDDDKKLAAITRSSAKEWKDLRKVLVEFFVCSDGVWTHKRIEQELTDAGNKKDASVSKAKAAAKARWNKPTSNASGNASSIPQALPEDCPTPTPTPTPIKTYVVNTHTDNSLDSSVCVETSAGSCCKALIQAGVSGCNPSHPILLALIDAGANEAEFAGSVAKGKTGFGYVLGIVKRQREDAAKLVLHKGELPQVSGPMSVNEARLDIASQIFGGRNGTDRSVIDITPGVSDQGRGKGIPETGAGIRESITCEMAGNDHG